VEQVGGGQNTTIDITLCLAKALPKKPGSPFLRGHWLSKRAFDLRAPQLTEEFDIEPMDDDGWKARGLPAKTFYLVDYLGSINEPASKDQHIAKVRLHSDVFQKLATERTDRLAKPMMMFLAAEIACELLCASISDWEDADEVAPRSPLAALLKRVNRITPCTLNDLKTLVKENGASRLRAILHAELKTVRSVAEA
jgi:hypothetical protein